MLLRILIELSNRMLSQEEVLGPKVIEQEKIVFERFKVQLDTVAALFGVS